MKECNVLYFSSKYENINNFENWAERESNVNVIKWCKNGDDKVADMPKIGIQTLAKIIDQQISISNLYVIIDYLSYIEFNDGRIKRDDKFYSTIKVIQQTILQYPEVNFLFDQSERLFPGNYEKINWKDILFNDSVVEESKIKEYKIKVEYSFHIFRREKGFILRELGYDNLFDGSNLRWALKKIYYKRLSAKENFENLQKTRCESLAIVIDDEPRQSRFNGFALFLSGYHVIQVHSAHMLALLNNIFKLKPGNEEEKIIIRDFDLQFPDVQEKEDFSGLNFYKVPIVDDSQEITIEEEQKMPEKVDGFQEMIDYVRNYRLDKDKWVLSGKSETLFWGKAMKAISTYVVTNGYDNLDVQESKEYREWGQKSGQLKVSGMLKPVSGLYYPFFTKLKDKNGEPLIKNHFRGTQYTTRKENYFINKKRENANHGVSLDIYDIVCEMQNRAENYFEKKHYIKAAVLAQEIIEILNGFHYQMMIKAYRLKFIAENSIAMDLVGADERQLVLDAEERVRIIKEDIRRIVYSQSKVDKGENLQRKIHRIEKENELLDHIFSDCRDICHKSGYFEVEDVFIGAMAHTNDGYSPKSLLRYMLCLIQIIWTGCCAGTRKLEQRLIIFTKRLKRCIINLKK